jgi:hypothetical protein
MRRYSLLAVLLLASRPVVYAQKSSTSAPPPPAPPVTHTSPASSPSSSSSSSSSMSHSSPSSFPSSSSSSGGSHSSGSSSFGGFDSSNRSNRDSSRDSSPATHGRNSSADAGSNSRTSRDNVSTPRDTGMDSSARRRNDGDAGGGLSRTSDRTSDKISERGSNKSQERTSDQLADRVSDRASDRGRNNGDMRNSGDGKSFEHEKQGVAGKDFGSSHVDKVKIAKNPQDPGSDDDKHRGKCDKEPCPVPAPKASPTPQLANIDWNQGRCGSGPCEPCPAGTVHSKNGTCVAAPPVVRCGPSQVRVGTICTPAEAAGMQTYDSQLTRSCSRFSIQSFNIRAQLTSARTNERSACSAGNRGSDCTSAQMRVAQLEQECEMLRTEASPYCLSSVDSCL